MDQQYDTPHQNSSLFLLTHSQLQPAELESSASALKRIAYSAQASATEQSSFQFLHFPFTHTASTIVLVDLGLNKIFDPQYGQRTLFFTKSCLISFWHSIHL